MTTSTDPRAAFLEDIDWLLATGETHPERIAARMGVERGWLMEKLRRYQRPDLIARMHKPPPPQQKVYP